MLPKLTYITEFLVCLSSHAMQLLSSSIKLLVVLEEAAGASLCNGPIGRIGTLYICRSCVNDGRSRQSELLKTIAEDVSILCAPATICRKGIFVFGIVNRTYAHKSSTAGVKHDAW
ncbi:hypothetical protein EZV62_002797 [Acer yangbiense]|uniref:Uncharacterized protein n=1 Tax=Acer yangbiense TaxID=1000413 RepID=A0A5C7IYL7_9ROSI|nr:hypothetical protein EZV62_002797 [Acer yangbiense]